MSQPQIEKDTRVQMRRGLPVGKSVDEWLLPGDILVAGGPPDWRGGFWAVFTREGKPGRRYWLQSGEVDMLPGEPPDTTD